MAAAYITITEYILNIVQLLNRMETILIKNFKAISNRNDKLIEVKKMTVLMGEQASGKSTVAKLIYFFKTLKEEITFELIENSEITATNCDEIISNRIRRYFIFLFGSTRHLSNFEINYTYQNGVRFKIKKNTEGNLHIELVGLLPVLRQMVKLKSELSSSSTSFNDLEQRERNRIIKNIGRSIRDFFGSNQNNLFLPASRNMTVMLEHHLTDIYARLENTIALTLDLQDSNRFQSENELILLKFLQYVRFLKSKFQRAGDFQGLIADELVLNPQLDTTQANELISKINLVLKGSYSNDQYGEKVVFDDGYVFLQNASSGQQESIRTFQDIFINLLYGDPIFRVIEEPESHLFASGQKHLIESLAILLNKNIDNQIVIPTHSPYILRVIDNLIKAHELRNQETEITVASNEWLDFDNVSAYNLVDGEISDAMNLEFRGIDAALFDKVSNQISNEFDELLNIQYS